MSETHYLVANLRQKLAKLIYPIDKLTKKNDCSKRAS